MIILKSMDAWLSGWEINLPRIQLFHNFMEINYLHGKSYPRIRV
jgi:hypothetical protein